MRGVETFQLPGRKEKCSCASTIAHGQERTCLGDRGDLFARASISIIMPIAILPMVP